MTTRGEAPVALPKGRALTWQVWIPEPSSTHPMVVPAVGWVQAGQLGTRDYRRLGCWSTGCTEQ